MGYELEVVHPATAVWLTENGYTYRHEVVTDAGVIDFLATHKDGHRLIVECKSKGTAYLLAIRQVLDYQRELGLQFRPAIAIPVDSITPTIKAACHRRGVDVIGVTPLPALPIASKVLEEQDAAFDSLVAGYFCTHALKMVNFHTENNTNPSRDISVLMHLVMDAPFNNPSIIMQWILNECCEENPIFAKFIALGSFEDESTYAPQQDYFLPHVVELILRGIPFVW